jgi:hypothetical protein
MSRLLTQQVAHPALRFDVSHREQRHVAGLARPARLQAAPEGALRLDRSCTLTFDQVGVIAVDAFQAVRERGARGRRQAAEQLAREARDQGFPFPDRRAVQVVE